MSTIYLDLSNDQNGLTKVDNELRQYQIGEFARIIIAYAGVKLLSMSIQSSRFSWVQGHSTKVFDAFVIINCHSIIVTIDTNKKRVKLDAVSKLARLGTYHSEPVMRACCLLVSLLPR